LGEAKVRRTRRIVIVCKKAPLMRIGNMIKYLLTLVIDKRRNSVVDAEIPGSCGDVFTVSDITKDSVRMFENAPVSPKCGLGCEGVGPFQWWDTIFLSDIVMCT
jgi:hypothetical protein